MAISGAVLGDALRAVGAGSRLVRPLAELAAGADGALRQAPPGLTPPGAASFLATCCQESDYLRTTREYGSGQRYAPFIGRGFVQCTWRENYAKFGAWCQARRLVDRADVFVANPAALEDYRFAWLTAVWYFEANGLWAHANRGDHYAVSQGVNRGPGAIGTDKAPMHWDARKRMFDALLRAGAVLLPGGAPAVAETGQLPPLREGDESELVWKLASWLNRTFPAYARIDAGERPPCRLGPQCVAAMTEFQRRSDIPTAPPFGWASKSWAAARALGFRP